MANDSERPVAPKPTELAPQKEEKDSSLEALAAISPKLHDLVELALAHLGPDDFSEITISIEGSEEVAGAVSLKSSADGPRISIEGKLGGEELGSTPGTPYLAHYDGSFYLKPSPSEPEFFKNGAVVEEGSPVGVVMVGKFKMAVKAEQSGRIYYRVENGQDVSEGDTLFTIDEPKKAQS